MGLDARRNVGVTIPEGIPDWLGRLIPVPAVPIELWLPWLGRLRAGGVGGASYGLVNGFHLGNSV